MAQIARVLLVLFALGFAPGALADEEANCGGIVGCNLGSFCEFPGGICGKDKQAGLCTPKPEVCTDQYEPVCGCDGKTYSNDCERQAAGVSKRADGKC